jgi:energy-coupling factor transporter ATP-binding protein EcfA2
MSDFRLGEMFPTVGTLKGERVYDWEQTRKLDCLGFKELAPGLADVIAHLEPPACFGVFGAWGSGKSTLAKCISDILKERLGERVRVAWFDTWLYDQHAGHEVCYALLRCIEKTLYAESKADLSARRALKRNLVATAAAAVGIGAKSLTAGQLNPVEDFFRARQLADKKMAHDYDAWVDSTERLAEDFRDVITRGLEHAHADRLIVVLDDLDRCLPDSVVTLLERLKNFLMHGRVVYVLAADRGAIVEAICQKYGYSRAYGERYLDKIALLCHDLPRNEGHGIMRLTMEQAAASINNAEGSQRVRAYLNDIDESYRALTESTLLNPRTTRKVATKLALLLSSPLWRKLYINEREMEPNVAKVFSAPGGELLPERDVATQAIRVTLLLLLFKESYPLAFGSYAQRLWEGLFVLTPSSPNPQPSRESIAIGTGIVENYGIEPGTAILMGRALHSLLPTKNTSSYDGIIKLMYRLLAGWL